MRAVAFHHLFKLGGQRSLAALPSEIVERAPDRHHLIDHSRSPVAKFIPQDFQAFDRSQCVLHLDPHTGQQTVKVTALAMQSSTIASCPRGNRARRSRGCISRRAVRVSPRGSSTSWTGRAGARGPGGQRARSGGQRTWRRDCRARG